MFQGEFVGSFIPAVCNNCMLHASAYLYDVTLYPLIGCLCAGWAEL